MRKSMDRLPGLKIITQREILPEEQSGTSNAKLKGYTQFPNPIQGSNYH